MRNDDGAEQDREQGRKQKPELGGKPGPERDRELDLTGFRDRELDLTGFRDRELDLTEFTEAIEGFNRFYIRLPDLSRLSFTTLSVLYELSRRSPQRLTELTRTEQVSQPAITQLVTRLERDGLVERHPDPDDRRAVLVHITDAGLKIVRDRHSDRTTRLAPLMEQLSPEERQSLAAALPALIHLAELGAGTN